jgi:hypothetical protein
MIADVLWVRLKLRSCLVLPSHPGWTGLDRSIAFLLHGIVKSRSSLPRSFYQLLTTVIWSWCYTSNMTDIRAARKYNCHDWINNLPTDSHNNLLWLSKILGCACTPSRSDCGRELVHNRNDRFVLPTSLLTYITYYLLFQLVESDGHGTQQIDISRILCKPAIRNIARPWHWCKLFLYFFWILSDVLALL